MASGEVIKGEKYSAMDKEQDLSKKIISVYNGSGSEKSLSQLISDLLENQIATWPELANGIGSLKTTKDRELQCNGFSVRLRHNPLRAKSTMAAVDKGSIDKRPCFLCPTNLPEEQKGILYRDKYLILCNPMPAFYGHMTIAALEHRPQSIEGDIESFLQLMADLKGSWTVLYNGPECGASAPDHYHFQAIPSGHLPIENESVEEGRLSEIACIDGVSMYRINDIGRDALLLKGTQSKLGPALHRVISTMKENQGLDKEPMMSIAGVERKGDHQIFIFPRAKHRPAAFFREGEEKIAVSPAVIEMCGVIVTPVERDLERLTAHDVENIYREVSLKPDMSGLNV